MNSIEVSALWPLVEALEYGDQRLSRAAAEALAELDEPTWRAVVRGEPQDWQRLGNCRDGRTFEPLLEQLVHDNSSVRAGAAEALGKLGDRRAGGPLIKALEHRELNFRRAAADPLIHALADGEKSVRRAAAEALAKLGEPTWQAVVMGEPQDWEHLANCGDARAFGLLIRQLGDASSSVPAAARALGKLGDKRAVGAADPGVG